MAHGSPQAPTIHKFAAEDTSLTVDNAYGGKTTFPVPAGTEIEFHIPGLHYNRIPNLLPSERLVLTEVSQRSIGRIPLHSGQGDSSRTGQGMRS